MLRKIDGYHLVRLDDRWSLTNTELIARPRQRRKRCTRAVKTARGETVDDEVEAAHNGCAATQNNVAAAACGGRSAGRGYNNDKNRTNGLAAPRRGEAAGGRPRPTGRVEALQWPQRQ